VARSTNLKRTLPVLGRCCRGLESHSDGERTSGDDVGTHSWQVLVSFPVSLLSRKKSTYCLFEFDGEVTKQCIWLLRVPALRDRPSGKMDERRGLRLRD
jgi:hypothetical protein